MTIFFTNLDNLAKQQPPYEVKVKREVSSSKNLIDAVLEEYFRGTTAQEKNRGIEAVWSGFTGYKQYDLS